MRSGPGLDVLPQDLRVPKRRFGAFAPGSSDLHAILQERGIDTLIVTGTATQVCCESTARDAMMLNYKVFFIADGNATFNDDEHNATLSAMAHAFCDVIDTDTMVGMIERVGAEAGDGLTPLPTHKQRMDGSMFTRRGFMAAAAGAAALPGLPAIAASPAGPPHRHDRRRTFPPLTAFPTTAAKGSAFSAIRHTTRW